MVSDETADAAHAQIGRSEVHDAVRHPRSLTITLAVVLTLVVTSLVVFVIGLALAAGQAASTPATVFSIASGGSFLGWYLKALIVGGSGRRTSRINVWPAIGLLTASCFAAATGYGLFEMLTGTHLGTRIALFVAGLMGAVAGLVAYVRDTDTDQDTGEQDDGSDAAASPALPGLDTPPASPASPASPAPGTSPTAPRHAADEATLPRVLIAPAPPRRGAADDDASSRAPADTAPAVRARRGA